MEKKNTFQTFEDLEVYREARAFRKKMYEVARWLPDIEKFGLASQMRCAAVSLTNNIAEGHGRYHYPDLVKFGLQARGSLEELIDDLNVCVDENYIPLREIETLKQEGWRLLRILNGHLRFLRNQQIEKKSALHDKPISYATDAEDPLDAEDCNDVTM
ncbi:MAG TPA: four helix bundle protein [Verrucomicrobiae bacterium]|nr:four helix bundle protein [Verrucomicrobiae bacterium]